MSSGSIKLLTRANEELQKAGYSSPSHRKEIVAGWKLLYSERFKQLHFIIFPITNDTLINDKGENTIAPKRYEKNKTHIPAPSNEVKKPIMERPAAIYTNLNTVKDYYNAQKIK